MATPVADPSSSSPAASSSLPVPIPVRRDTSSSYGSDAYAPLPPGRWLLDFHGNCSRCHHHHNAVRVKVDVSRDPDTVSHIQCRGCQEKWLAIGGRNATQISLLSVNSTRPDPTEADVRYTLISMVRSTTAIASMSPVLAGIPEGSSIWSSSRQRFRRAPPGEDNVLPSDSAAQGPTVDTSVEEIQPPNTIKLPRISSNPAAPIQQHHHFANTRQRLRARWHTLHRIRIKVSISKPPQPSDKSLGKRPVRDPNPSSDAGTLGPASPASTAAENLALNDVCSLEAAIRFKKDLAREKPYLNSLDSEKDRTAWFRARYTAFKNRPVKPATSPPASSAVVNAILVNSTDQLQQHTSLRPNCCSTDLVGLGSHSGLFDRFWLNNPVPRSSTLSISDRASENEIASDDNAALVSLPYLVTEIERQGSESPRPYSLPPPLRTVQQLRQGQPEPRFSMDSTVIGDTLSLSQTRSPAASDRHSQASTIRASLFGGTQLSMSQTSLASH